MPRNLARRQDVFSNSARRPGSNPLSGVLDVLAQCQSGIMPAENQIAGAIGTLLGMIGEEKRRRNASTLPPQQPVDVQYPSGERLIGTDELPETTSQTVEAERGMANIMDDMGIPEEAREIAPQILNNVVAHPDGTFSSADGSVSIGRREQLMYMIQRTMQEIGEEMARCGGHAVADVGPDLRTRLTTRGADGRRRMITVEPARIANG